MKDKKLGFIGAGNMAEAVIKGLVASKAFSQKNISIYDPSISRLDLILSRYGVSGWSSNKQVCENSDIVILAVKPQVMDEILREISPWVKPGHLIVSVAAGVSISRIAEVLGKHIRIIRTMPNSPCWVRQGITAIAGGEQAFPHDLAMVKKIFEAVGTVLETTEDQMNTVTALSGSGPAFFTLIVEAFARSGVKHGLSYDESLKLANLTMSGTAAVISESVILRKEKTTSDLINIVSSPGGTTIAGLNVLKEKKIDDIIDETIGAAARRAQELSEGK